MTKEKKATLSLYNQDLTITSRKRGDTIYVDIIADDGRDIAMLSDVPLKNLYAMIGTLLEEMQ